MAGRKGTDLVIEVKDAGSGVVVGGAIIAAPAVPVPLDLAVQPSFAGAPTEPEISLLFEGFGLPAEVKVFDASGGLALFSFPLP